jgi:hypothetical protein
MHWVPLQVFGVGSMFKEYAPLELAAESMEQRQRYGADTLGRDGAATVVFAGVAALPCVRLVVQALQWFGTFDTPKHELLASLQLFCASHSLLDVSALASLLAFWHAREVRRASLSSLI